MNSSRGACLPMSRAISQRNAALRRSPMKTSRRKLCMCLAAIVAVAAASPGRLCGRTAAAKSGGSDEQWSIQVETVEPGETGLAYSFQIATYENLLEELTKKHQFKHVFRE